MNIDFQELQYADCVNQVEHLATLNLLALLNPCMKKMSCDSKPL